MPHCGEPLLLSNLVCSDLGLGAADAICSTEASRFHHAARRRGNMAALGARAAVRKGFSGRCSLSGRASGHAFARCLHTERIAGWRLTHRTIRDNSSAIRSMQRAELATQRRGMRVLVMML